MTQKTASKAGFKSNYEYLEAYFDLLYLRSCLFAVRNMDSILGSGSSRFMDEAKDFYVKLGLKSKRNASEQRSKLENECIKERQDFRDRIKSSNIPLHLEDIASANQLSEFEKDVVAMALAVATDTRFTTLAERLNFRTCHKFWEIKEFLNILTDAFDERVKFRKYFMATGKLNSKGLLLLEDRASHSGTECSFLEMAIQLPLRISSAIYGEESPEDMILAFSEVVAPDVSIENVVLDDTLKQEVVNLLLDRDTYLRRRKEWGIDKILAYGRGTIMLFSGAPGTGKTMLAHALANFAGLKMLQVNVPNLLDSHAAFQDCFRLVLREASLQKAILFFDEADELFSDRAGNRNMPTILREFEKFDGVAILATNRKQNLDEALDRRILYKLDFGIPTPEMRQKIWREHLPETLPLAENVKIDELAESFEFSGGYIKNAVLLACQKAIARKGKNAKVFHDDLKWGAKKQRDSQLERYTDKVTPKVNLNDIIVPDRITRQLKQIINEYRNYSTVYEKWNFKDVIHHGRAITALFHGQSGVGKTMAAEAVASELGLNLYPVQIPAVVSCYVGETSKNLKNVFQSAMDAEAVLLFDEADALFTARIGDASHHSVYINQQVDTLLQQIESFKGVVILTSNMPERLDQAFMRRIRHHLEFPFPSPEARTKIWRHHFPKESPLENNIDFKDIGKNYELSGGSIRNVAVKAAFEAACGNKQKINTELIKKLIREETQNYTNKKIIGFSMPISKHAALTNTANA